MNRRILFLAALLVCAAPAAAQGRGIKVPGFDIRWGATHQQVTTYWRETPLRETHERGVSLLDFEPWEGMNWTVAVHDQQGLIGIMGSSLAALPAQGCDGVFEAWLAGMRRSFAGITPIGRRTVPAGESACAAVKAGRGTVAFSFAEPRGGSVATLWIDPADGLAKYVIGTQTFRQWAGVEGIAQSIGLSGTGGTPSPSTPSPSTTLPSTPAQSAAAPPASGARNLGVTDRAMRAIRPGASYADVVAIIGREGTRAAAVAGSGANSQTFTWRGGPLESIGVTFLDGQAIMTMQSGMGPEGAVAPVTVAQYDLLREGMTYEEVSRVLGSPGIYNGFTGMMGHVSESYLWRGRAPGSSISAIFSRGRMTQKVQFGMN